jgi:ketosteroid isomerase-like protein
MVNDEDLTRRIDDLERRIQRLEDEREILRVLHRFNRAVDYAGDVPAFGQAFTDDAVVLVTDAEGNVLQESRGLEAIQAHQARSEARRTRRPKHVLGEPLVEIDGDHARLETYFVAYEDVGNGPFVSVYGISTSTFVRRDGEWRMTERRGTTEAVAPRT